MKRKKPSGKTRKKQRPTNIKASPVKRKTTQRVNAKANQNKKYLWPSLDTFVKLVQLLTTVIKFFEDH